MVLDGDTARDDGGGAGGVMTLNGRLKEGKMAEGHYRRGEGDEGKKRTGSAAVPDCLCV